MKKTLLGKFGEFRLLKRLEKKLRGKEPAGSGVIVGIGDDAFAAKFPKHKLLIATNDVLVENIHFRRKWILPQELGYKAMAVNLSDLAAMGGAEPLYALVGLAMPGDISVDYVDKLYIGMYKACKEFGFMIAGGDTVSSKKDIVISITLIGKTSSRHLIERSGAKPGDFIYVTGTFGDSAAGLKILEKKGRRANSIEKKLIARHIKPVPRIQTAGRLARTGKITSMTDSSDGLAASLRFIAEKSGVGAEIITEQIPVSGAQKIFSAREGIISVELALNGGEDYELVFTARPGTKDLEKISRDITRIGVINDSGKVTYFSRGKAVDIAARGYEAFV